MLLVGVGGASVIRLNERRRVDAVVEAKRFSTFSLF